jgi:hypothetical protein
MPQNSVSGASGKAPILTLSGHFKRELILAALLQVLPILFVQFCQSVLIFRYSMRVRLCPVRNGSGDAKAASPCDTYEAMVAR